MTQSVLSKYQLTPTPPLPAKCIGCKKDAKGNEDFIDLAESMDFYGAILLCNDCAKEIATLVGYMPTIEAEHVQVDNSFLIRDLEVLTEKVKALENVLRVYGLGFPPDSELTVSNSSGLDQEPADKETGADSGVVKDPESGLFE